MKILIKLGIVLVSLVVLLFGGIYFIFNTGKQVQVEWTENDLSSGLEKSKVLIGDLEEINLSTLAENNFSTSGTNEIEDYFTSEEMSALLSTANINGPIKNINVSFGENNNGEVSFVLSETFTDFLREQGMIERYVGPVVYAAEIQDYVDNTPSGFSVTEIIIGYITNLVNRSPVYATGELYRDSENTVRININSLRVGRISLPQDTIRKVEYETLRVVNTIISPENGFHIEELHIKDGKFHYKGTLPAEVYGEKL